MMGNELFRLLASTSLATSVAVALVGLLRRPVRRAAGAVVGYWLWLIVPAVAVAVLLPAAHGVIVSRAAVFTGHISSVLTAAVTGKAAPGRRTDIIHLALCLWGAGFITLGILTVKRQQVLSPILRSLTHDPGGFYRGQVDVPMLVGAWHPKIIVPADFEARYSKEERDLILAHERAHASRHDVVANLFGSLVVCIYWFNPLMFRALGWLRMDQELACDARVLGERGNARRQYAETLLKTQLVAESAWRFPLGCSWRSIHPPKERVAMLKRPYPVRARRLAGVCLVAALTAATAYAAWAAEPAMSEGPKVWIDFRIRMTNPESPHFVIVLNTRYVVASGETINDDKDGMPLLRAGEWRLGCTPFLPDALGPSPDWSDQKARGIPIPAPGPILLECGIQHNGGNVQNVSALAKDGSPVVIDVAKPGSALQYHLEVTPYSTMPGDFIDHLTQRPVRMDAQSPTQSQR
jgi:beta-lactamase regulating signal transducer with metallopeptidase domain